MAAVLHGQHLRRWILSLPPVEFVMQQLRELLIGSLKCGPIPQHVAFVMDGNRRYARKHKVETVEGHHMGFEALARVLEVCYKSGVRVVTIYAFSIENFKRSRYEVDALMDMAKTKLVQMSQHGALFDRYGASVRILGDRSLVRPDVLAHVDRAVEMTQHNDRAVLNVCFPYTGREEITHSIRETVREFSTPSPARPLPKRAFSETRIQRNLLNRQQFPSEAEERAFVRQQQQLWEQEQLQQQQRQTDSPPSIPEDILDSASVASASETSHDGVDTSSTFAPASSHTSHSPSPQLRPATTHGKPSKPSTSFHSSAATSAVGAHTSLPDPESITADTLTKNTYTFDAPPLDLLIRTSGVHRLSDFMLWQCHENTEIRFLDCLWPELDLWQFLPVLLEWQWRQRREGLQAA